MSFPVCHCFGKLTFECMALDLCHNCDKTCDGRLFVLSSKTSFSQVVPLAFAIVPAENKDHLNWLAKHCIHADIPIQDNPLFVDKGCFLCVAKDLHNQLPDGQNMFFIQMCDCHFLKTIHSKCFVKSDCLWQTIQHKATETSDLPAFKDF